MLGASSCFPIPNEQLYSDASGANTVTVNGQICLSAGIDFSGHIRPQQAL